MDDESDISAAKNISDGHTTMLQILERRKIRLEASLTFWEKEDIMQLTSYLIKSDDDSLFNDVIPQLTRCIKEENSLGKKVTLGMCLELLPAMQRLLKTKYEDYILTSLDFLRVMCHRWYLELKHVEKGEGDLKNQSLSLKPIHLELMSMQNTVKKLCRRDGKIGERAKVLLNILEEVA